MIADDFGSFCLYPEISDECVLKARPEMISDLISNFDKSRFVEFNVSDRWRREFDQVAKSLAISFKKRLFYAIS